ncbi:hypothetical protein OX283_004675 [Flavobacterium sp. SUN052]|uniref:hypothetical protein n=1 Tax=Flavobacterium sp. SUN052 TaxID=3002441 RepID=UPI00237D968E|nr:hypothetical protein [Flavobacterium sp. SUN052]MEC4003940.1 hypothetical protein [Flavobacterium sp. SUN052]
MNKLLLLFALAITSFSTAQTKALTEKGQEVLLFDNGTWKYQNDSISTKTDSLKINKKEFTKTTGATFLTKSKNFNVGVYINPTKWTFAPHRDNETSPEYRYSLKSGNGFAMIITEGTQIDLENLRQIALLNAQKASVDVVETSAEYRIVNHKKILCLKFQGTIKGIKFVYFGYYYSNNKGTVQLITYTSQQSFILLEKELENFLNGLVEINEP